MHEAVAAYQNTTHYHGGRDPRDELTAYLSSPSEDVPDIVAWWGVSVLSIFLFCQHLLSKSQLHSLQYPTLSHIAHDYLPIQGSAVPSE